MILRGTYKWDAFLRTVNRYVAGRTEEVPKIQPTGAAQLAYLGGGYWRAVLLYNSTSHLLEYQPMTDLYGVYLVNPSRNQDEIQAVERGVAVLAGFEYVDPASVGL